MLVSEAVHYMSEVAGSIPDGSLTSSFQPHYGPGVSSASDMNECQEYLRGAKAGRSVGLTTLPTSCADCLEMLGASSSWNPQGLCRP
jgi:hypothetical protein